MFWGRLDRFMWRFYEGLGVGRVTFWLRFWYFWKVVELIISKVVGRFLGLGWSIWDIRADRLVEYIFGKGSYEPFKMFALSSSKSFPSKGLLRQHIS